MIERTHLPWAAEHAPDRPILPPTNRGGRLTGIEALRGIAALAVLVYHVARHLAQAGGPGMPRWFAGGHAGVDIFFVLSGFVMLHVHHRDIGRPARLAHYAYQRATRIFPIYWVALAATVAMMALGRGGWPGAGWLASSAALLPGAREPILGVAWTLQFEMLFYAGFALLIVRRALGLAVLGLWFAGAIAGLAGARFAAFPMLCDPYALEFAFGLGIAYLVRGRPLARPGPAWRAGAVLLLMAAGLESAGVMDGHAGIGRIAYGLPAALLIWGLVAAERQGRLRVPALLTQLGRASYSLYLFQFVFVGLAWGAMTRSGIAASAPIAVQFMLLIAAGLAGGLAVAAGIERPLLAAFRRHRPVAP